LRLAFDEIASDCRDQSHTPLSALICTAGLNRRTFLLPLMLPVLAYHRAVGSGGNLSSRRDSLDDPDLAWILAIFGGWRKPGWLFQQRSYPGGRTRQFSVRRERVAEVRAIIGS